MSYKSNVHTNSTCNTRYRSPNGKHRRKLLSYWKISIDDAERIQPQQSAFIHKPTELNQFSYNYRKAQPNGGNFIFTLNILLYLQYYNF